MKTNTDDALYAKIKYSLKPVPPKVEGVRSPKELWPHLRHISQSSGGEWAVVQIQALFRGYKVRGRKRYSRPIYRYQKYKSEVTIPRVDFSEVYSSQA